MPSVYIETFGCQMNEADSRYIAERAAAAGYGIVSAPEEANVVVLNTCTVRDSAERRAYGRMNHFNALKASDPSVRLVVTGCLAEQDRQTAAATGTARGRDFRHAGAGAARRPARRMVL